MKTKKIQEPCGKGSMKLCILKKAHKTNSPSSLLVDNETITNIPQMAEHFNQYFTSIGKTLQKSIPPTKRQFSDYLKDSNQNRFFIQPTTAEEVKDISISLPYGHVWNTAVMFGLVLLVATWNCWISYRNGYVGLLVLHLLPLLNPWVIVEM